ncbi:MAG: BrnT family toxin [Candidatus Hodarchaeota archaeon]
MLGKTDNERLLFVVFTIRSNKIRVISARDMNRKERRLYCEQIEKGTKIQD